MEYINHILLVVSWLLGAGVCVFLIYRGLVLIKSNQSCDVSLVFKEGNPEISGKLKAGFFLLALGLLGLLFLIVQFWQALYAFALLGIGASIVALIKKREV
ncbi:hypothetical protein [Pseudodesulfovibrio sediminis]|uniref:DUF3784 domain-containing protein n=1 Tax=Pseudodesulfovibrio sediminis TaxID=2810563 RepID=A0ABN6ET47_9BACT|nr:hypothetical protein [Pseudodesulfovibrio sediminis]BCS89521.1 hypothetical protein PSDVSF_27630 [Pseudodesulfovibrio sediminis]